MNRPDPNRLSREPASPGALAALLRALDTPRSAPTAPTPASPVAAETAARVAGAQGRLTFGAGDLVLGPSAGGRLGELAAQAGGRTMADLASAAVFPNHAVPARIAMDWARSTRTALVFDLTHLDDLDGILSGAGPGARTLAGWQLRYLRAGWANAVHPFAPVVRFLAGPDTVGTPWPAA